MEDFLYPEEYKDILQELMEDPSITPLLIKQFKECFVYDEGWVMCGIDFNSLEDMISALTTRDPNKLKVYTEGYDGHSLRAFSYFSHLMPDIIGDTVKSINSIKKLYENFRQKSKGPTFCKTYGGTIFALQKQCGLSLEEAIRINDNYDELYQVSIQWVQDKLNQATKDGYVTGAFGLRVRTPLLHQVIRGNSRTPYEAEAEGRTAGNALGQSWCLLNNRASVEFMGKVRNSPTRNSIKPIAHIHDAQYYLVRNRINELKYLNDNLVEAVSWQNHPDIYHPTVRLGGKVEIFFPTWAESISLPNEATNTDIKEIINNQDIRIRYSGLCETYYVL